MHTNSILLFEKYAKPYFKPSLRVLEIGPDKLPSTYQSLINDDSIIWHTTDINNNENLTYPTSDEYMSQIPDNTYDVVLCGQVIEHVKKIWVWISHIERMCADKGHIIIISPVSWPYHEAPVDCWRIYPSGMEALLEDTSFEIIDCHFESLELSRYRKDIPGKSPEDQNKFKRLFFKTEGLFGFPVERAYDLITIAQKT